MILAALEKKRKKEKKSDKLRKRKIRCGHVGVLINFFVAEHLRSHLCAIKFRKENYINQAAIN